jgi:hypothetical protein
MTMGHSTPRNIPARTCSVCKSAACNADGKCKTCRFRALGLARRKYQFTPALDADLRKAYSHEKFKDMRSDLRALRQRTGWPAAAFYQRAIALDITRDKGRPWTPADDSMLRQFVQANHSMFKMSAAMKRSYAAIAKRLGTLELSGKVKLPGFSQDRMAKMLGVANTSVARWVSWGWILLDINQRITITMAQRFMAEHSDCYYLPRVNDRWFKLVMFGTVAAKRNKLIA